MGFFKEFKEDLSQAVNELLPEDVLDETSSVNTSGEDVIDNTDGYVEDVAMTEENQENNIDEELLNALLADENSDFNEELNDLIDALPEDSEGYPEELLEDYEDKTEEEPVEDKKEVHSSEPTDFDDTEVTTITKSTVINGNLNTNGSLEIMGTINGDVSCNGKLSILGSVTGNCTAGDVYVGAKRLTGSIMSTSAVKIGLGTVVVGDISATEGTIAGAVKGDIDISGPIIVESSAVIKGNIKAQSIQIDKGAVIEGFCSLSYASVDIDNIFE